MAAFSCAIDASTPVRCYLLYIYEKVPADLICCPSKGSGNSELVLRMLIGPVDASQVPHGNKMRGLL